MFFGNPHHLTRPRKEASHSMVEASHRHPSARSGCLQVRWALTNQWRPWPMRERDPFEPLQQIDDSQTEVQSIVQPMALRPCGLTPQHLNLYAAAPGQYRTFQQEGDDATRSGQLVRLAVYRHRISEGH